MQATWTQPLRDDRPHRAIRVLTATCAGLLAGATAVLADGDLVVPVALPIALGVLLAMVTHPSATFSALLACTLLFEQYRIFGLEAPLTLRVPFFENFNSSLGVPLSANPVEVLLVTVAGSWLVAGLATGRLRFRASPLHAPVLVLMAVLAAFVAFGVARGGELGVALWEIRALSYLGAAFLVGSQVVRTHRQVVVNTWCILLPISIKGVQGVWRWAVDLGFELGDVPAITSHECAVFIMTSLVLGVALFAFRGPRSMRVLAAATAPTALLTFVLAQRRVAYGCLVFGMVMLFLYLPARLKRVALALALAAIPLVGAYSAAYWDSTGGPGVPVQQVRSIFGPDATGEVDSSNTYRDVERANLVATLRASPAGLGFGNKYLVVEPLDEIDFPLWEYIPHNCVLWLWVKTGFLGIAVFFVCVGLMVIQLTIDFRTTTRPLYKCLLVTAVVFLVCQVVVAYYDLQLTFYRNMVYLGALLAMTVPVHAEARRNAALGLTCRDPHPAHLDDAAEGAPCR